MTAGYPTKGERPPWSWQGVSALVLAVAIGGGWLAGITLAALSARTGGLDPELSQLLNGIGQVLAGALGTYLGFAASERQTATAVEAVANATSPPPTPDPPTTAAPVAVVSPTGVDGA